jgi:hypothetical protein
MEFVINISFCRSLQSNAVDTLDTTPKIMIWTRNPTAIPSLQKKKKPD